MGRIPKTLLALLNDLSSDVADWVLDQLLTAMKLALEGSRKPLVLRVLPRLEGYHKNLRPDDDKPPFEAVYLFVSRDGGIQVSAVFLDGRMEVLSDASPNWDIKIVFKDVQGFWRLIFSGGNGVLESIYVNDVEIYGNVNFLFKFAFMARDLAGRLGLGLRLRD
jgi:hypothetical protein